MGIIFVSGCAVHRAANQPSLKDTTVLQSGVSRDRVIAEFGPPISSEEYEDGKKEIYTFIQGYSKSAKAGSAFLHGATDVLTLGLWEIVDTPVEGSFNGKKMTVRVIYGPDDPVKSAETLAITDP